MPAIVSLCPYCRRGGVRGSERLVGSVATCPKCGSQFTVVPEENPPAVVDETRPHGLATDVTEPSPVLPGAAPSSEDDHPESDPALTASLIGLICFGLGVLATQLPFGRFIGLGFCALGVLLGIVSLLGEGRARKFGAAAVGFNLIAVSLLALVPTWLGFDPIGEDPNAGQPQGAYTINLNTNEPGVADRTDAGKAMYANADVRIAARTGVGPLELVGPNGQQRRTRENVLRIQLKITNGGVARRIPLTDWAAAAPGEGVTLTDPAGKPLKRKKLESGWNPAGFEKHDGLFPGKSADVALFYEAPATTKANRIEYLNLDLPGAGVGQQEPIRFKLPGPF